MKRFTATLFICATALFADTAETAYFRASMLPANEVPPPDIKGSAAATLIAHIVRNDDGNIVSGTMDFIIGYNFTGPVTITGLHIHAAPAGVNGNITIKTDTGAGPASIVSDTGRGTLSKPGQILPTDQPAIDTLNGLMNDPSQYYVNIHTTDFPGGAMRAQLQRADVTVLMGLMSPANETPPITGQQASGVSQVVVLATRDSSGALTSGQAIFDINFNFGKQTTITGFHIHNGAEGVAGPVILNTGIGGGPASVQTEASGVGALRRIVEVDMTKQEQVDTLDGLFTHPADYYINMHTTEFGGGLIRDQLRTTDTLNFQVTMLPSNETPPITNLDASAPAVVQVHTIRTDDGTVLAGTVIFDVNYRFPAAHVEFTGLHVHDGPAGVAGPVRLNSGLSGGNPVVTETGFGNVYQFVTISDSLGIATLNSLVLTPENHYVNIHTSVNPGGAVRAQLAPVTPSP